MEYASKPPGLASYRVVASSRDETEILIPVFSRKACKMKALVQRVMNASVSGNHNWVLIPFNYLSLIVTVNGEVISSIEQGICVLVGISSTDTKKDMEYIVRKLLSIKLFDDETSKRWKKSIVDKQLEVLCVSQFTLYNTWK
ncbi:D-tyrosyl-tRNA(Tyr) deacylase, partial [Operophtera brumata]